MTKDDNSIKPTRKRKLPIRNIVDADFVSFPNSASRVMDDLLLPSQHDRIILSELWNNNGPTRFSKSDKPPPQVTLGLPNKKNKEQHTITHKSYKQRLKEDHDETLDLSGHIIIPATLVNDMTAAAEANKKLLARKQDEYDDNDATVNNIEDDAKAIEDVATEPNDQPETQDTNDFDDNTCQIHKEQVVPVSTIENGTLTNNTEITTLDDASDDKEDMDKHDQSNITSINKPAAKTTHSNKKLQKLKKSKALDWIENNSTTLLSSSIGQERKRRLVDKLQQPYIKKTRITSIWYIE